MLIVTAKCRGLSPFLMNPMSRETLEDLRVKTPKNKRTDWTPEQEAETKLLKDNEGRLGFPMEYLFSCLVNGGRKVKNGKNQISTAKDTTVPSFLTITDSFIPFTSHSPWVVDMRRGVGNSGKVPVAICIVRPKIVNWDFEVKLEIDEKEIQPDVVKQLLVAAGTKMGLGDFRPSKKGPFGRFEVVDWQVKKATSDKAA